MPPSYLRHSNCDWLSHTTWSNESCGHIPRGMVTAILFPADQVMCDWLNHTTWFHSNRVLPRSMEFEYVASFVYTIVANMLCRLFDDRKYMDIYLPIPQEYCYLGKQIKFVFSRINTCDLSYLVNF